jgi:hypothetical protein
MKVRAISHGQHQGRMYAPGEVFEIDGKEQPIYKTDANGGLFKGKDGKPVIEGHRSAKADWMEEVKEEHHEKKSLLGGIFSHES